MAGKKGSALTKPMTLSDTLADFIGKPKESRGQVVKKVWAYIKKHKLQNPTNRRMIEPDDVLAEIIGSRPISMFKMTAKLNEHME